MTTQQPPLCIDASGQCSPHVLIDGVPSPLPAHTPLDDIVAWLMEHGDGDIPSEIYDVPSDTHAIVDLYGQIHWHTPAE